uniref:Tc1-like transposase DDE domain-containing protein n=1 Tax=Oryzias latipes TaxID=8090 RepID=A0A3P9HR97_ORYLA
MHNNSPSHALRNISASLAAMDRKGDKLMVWPPSSPDINPVQNLWSIIIIGGWEAVHIQTGSETLKKITSSMAATKSGVLFQM